MLTQPFSRLIATLFLITTLILAACSTPAEETVRATMATDTNELQVATQVEPTATIEVTEVIPDPTQAIVPTAIVATPVTAEQLETATTITLADAATTITGAGATVNDNGVTITQSGTYILQGTLTDGQILVDSSDDAPVYLVLDGIDVSNSTTSPLFISNADEVIIELATGSQNILTDGASYIFADETTDEPNAALFSKADMTLVGDGSLTVNGNYNDGIASKDGLVIAGGTLLVNAIDDGIRGKDYLIVQGGDLTVSAEDDGLKADNEEDTTLGYVLIEAGNVTITSGGKGINGTNLLTVDGGTLVVNSADDTVHSNGDIVINAGSMTLASGDDAIHADSSITVNGGDIDITQSYEGIESTIITLNAGTISLVSSDDGINAADVTAVTTGGRGGGGAAEGVYLIINGGTLIVDAGGDGVDSNGVIEMYDGLIIVNGPTADNNGPLDYNGTFTMVGGFFVATGSAGMAQAPSTISTQNSLLVNFDQTLTAGTLVHIESADGTNLLTFAPSKPFQSVAFSSPELVQDETYTVYYGGTASGDTLAGLYESADYQNGTQFVQLTVDSSVTTYGEVVRGGRR